MTFQRQDHETHHLKLLCKQEPAAKGFLETRFVRFGPDKLQAAGGKGENHPADQRRSVTHAWLHIRDLLQLLRGGMWLRRRPGSLQILDQASNSISTVQRPFDKQASVRCQHAAAMTAQGLQGQRDPEKPPVPHLSDLQLKEALGVPPRSSQGATITLQPRRATASEASTCCSSPKSFPPSATAVVFVAPFGQMVVLLGLREELYSLTARKIPLIELQQHAYKFCMHK